MAYRIVVVALVWGALALSLSGCLAALPLAAAAVGGAGTYVGLKKGGEQDRARDEEAFTRATATALDVSPSRVGVSDLHRGFKDRWTAQVSGHSYSCTAFSSTLHDPSCMRMADAGR